MSDTERTSLRALLDVVINKLQYDESYNFQTEGEEEIMFQEFRKQLKVLFDTIAQVVTHVFVVCGVHQYYTYGGQTLWLMLLGYGALIQQE